jgi:hypothetical protein
MFHVKHWRRNEAANLGHQKAQVLRALPKLFHVKHSRTRCSAPCRRLTNRRSLFATRYSLLAAVLPVANRHSPFAAVEPKFLERFQNCFT